MNSGFELFKYKKDSNFPIMQFIMIEPWNKIIPSSSSFVIQICGQSFIKKKKKIVDNCFLLDESSMWLEFSSVIFYCWMLIILTHLLLKKKKVKLRKKKYTILFRLRHDSPKFHQKEHHSLSRTYNSSIHLSFAHISNPISESIHIY